MQDKEAERLIGRGGAACPKALVEIGLTSALRTTRRTQRNRRSLLRVHAPHGLTVLAYGFS
jgi:hypothetical protein